MASNNHIERVSKNIGRTEEGYLVCRNAVIARTGYRTYRFSELAPYFKQKVGEWFPDIGADDDVEFYTPPSELFSAATIATFEGKGLTDEHPPELLNPENHAEYNCGHMANVRKGDAALDGGDWPLVADIYITVDEAIKKYEDGVRELSCGYVHDVIKGEKRISTVDIRGNHVALVPKGRAGSEVCINDAAPEAKKGIFRMAIKDHGDIITLGLNSITDQEERAKAIRIALDAAAKDSEEETEEEKKKREKKEKEEREEKEAKDAAEKKAAEDKAAKDAEDDMTDAEAMEKIESVRDMLDDLEEHIEGGGEEGEGEAEDASPEAKKEMVGSSKDAVAKDALTELRALKPIVAKSRDRKLRSAYDAQIKRALPGKPVSAAGGGYESFANAAERRHKTATDSMKQGESVGGVAFASPELDKIFADRKGKN